MAAHGSLGSSSQAISTLKKMPEMPKPTPARASEVGQHLTTQRRKVSVNPLSFEPP